MSAALLAGLDAALIVCVLGITFSLLAYAELGARALLVSMVASVVALIVGGLATTLAGRDLSTIVGPTATGTLVIASLVHDLQGIAAARGHLGVAVAGAVVVVLAAGLAQLLFARLRIGAALKFVPYPVLMGFSNTVALLLMINLIPAALGHGYVGHLVEAPRWFVDWEPRALLVAAIGFAAGWGVRRRLPQLPASFVALVVATATHELIAASCDACSPGPTVDLGAPASIGRADIDGIGLVVSMGLPYWSAVLQAALVLAVLHSLFSLLAAAQLTRPKDPPVDGNRLLRSLAIGNLASGLLLGLPVAIIVSASRVVRRPGPRHRILTMTTYLIAVALLFGIGRVWFARVPMAAVAAAVFTITIGLFDPATMPLLRQAWAGPSARRAMLGPFAIASLVVAIGLIRGLAAALFIGALAAVCLLAIEMRRGVVVAIDDARTRRSRRVRPNADAERLDALGAQVRIIGLGHWLYFGTADELGDVLERQVDARWLLLDLRDVAGVDLTAARSLIHAAERLAERGMHLVVTGLPAHDPRRHAIDLLVRHRRDPPVTLVDDLDTALETAEDDLLGEPSDTGRDEPFAFPHLSPDDTQRLEPWMHPVRLAAGDALFRAGDAGDALYAIRHGRLSIRLAADGADSRRLLTFGDGGLFGELALLDGRPRSADAVADTDCTLWMITRERLAMLAVADPALHAKVLAAIALHLARRLRETTRLLNLR